MIRKIILFLGISLFLFFLPPCLQGETEKPVEEKPAFELPEVVIIGEDQSRVTIGGERKPLVDQPFLRKVEVGLEPVGKISLLSLPLGKDINITEINFGYGRFETLKGGLTHGRQIKDKGHYLLGIGKYKTDGEFSDRHYNIDDAFLEVGFRPGEKLDLKIATSGLLKDYRLSNSTITQKIDLLNLELGAKAKIKEEGSLGCQFFGRIGNLKNDSKASGDIGGLRLQAGIGFGQGNVFNLEAQLYQERLKLDGDRRRYLVSSISLSQEFLLFDKVWANLGVEYKEKSKPFSSLIFPTARFSYELIPNFSLWVRYKPEMIVPSFDELYIANDYVDVNLNLLPEKRKFSLEEGMEYKLGQNLSGSISFFQKKFKNFIAIFDDGRLGNLQNIPKVYSQGVDASFIYILRKNFTQQLRYVYQKTEDEDRPDERVPYTPSHTVRISSHYSYGPLSVLLSALIESERYYNRSESLPLYWTMETEISCNITKQVILYLQGENLLREKYAERFGYPLDHTKFLGGFKVKW